MLSLWEKEFMLDYDLIIIGSGLTGLSCAAEVLEKYPNERVLILERGLLPSGASTKNAGFACFGSLTELLYDIDAMGASAALTLVEERVHGLQLLRKRLGDEAIGYLNDGGYELIGNNELSALNRLNEANELLYPMFKQQVYQDRPLFVEKFGFASDDVKTIVSIAGEGQLNTGLMMRSLIQYVIGLGAQIMTGAEVVSLLSDKWEGNTVTVKDAGGEKLALQAKKIAVCTNAFARRLLPEIDVLPGRGQVICTSPIEGLKFSGSFHMDQGFYYFRNFGNRVIFGGGRNLDIAGEETDVPGLNDTIGAELVRKLHKLILPSIKFKIEHRWSGVMGFGSSKSPIVKLAAPKVAVGVRLSGMGVALGSKIGAQLADLLYERGPA